MPVIAVAGAVAGATSLATVGVAGLGVWGTIGAIGGIVSGIGAITGNDTLMRLGAVAGLAGGVGAFAQSKGWIASGSAMGTAGAEAAGGNIDALTKTAAPGVAPVVEPVVPDFGQAAGSNAAELGQTAGLAQNGLVDATSIGQNITSANPLLNATEPANALFDAPSPAAAALSPPSPPALERNIVNYGSQEPASSLMPNVPGKDSGSILSRLEGFGKFVKENKELSSIAANFIGGMFDDKKEAETEYLKAKTEETRAKTANGSAVPDMRAKLKQSGPIWKPSSPTYNAPRPSGLFYAR